MSVTGALIEKAKESFGLDQWATAFDVPTVEVTTNELDLSGTYPANTESYNLKTAGTVDTFDGDFDAVSEFSDVENGYELTVNGSSGDKIHFESAEAPRYVPGHESLFAISIKIQKQLEPGQVVKFGLGEVDSNLDVINGYVWEIKHDIKILKVFSGGDEVIESEDGNWDNNPYEDFDISNITPIVHRGFFNWYGVGSWRAVEDFTRADSGPQLNETIDELSRNDDFITEEINLHIFCQIECTQETSSLTVKAGSMEYKIRGEGTRTTRVKESHEFSVTNGSIGSIDIYGADDISDATPVKAVRIEPEKDNIFTELRNMKAVATDDLVLTAFAVRADDTDASGWITPQQQNMDNSNVEETKSFTTIPTITKDGETRIKGRQLGLLSVQGGQGSDVGSQREESVQTAFYPDEVIIIVGYTDSAAGADIDLEYTVIQEW